MFNIKPSSPWFLASALGLLIYLFHASPVFAANACQSNGIGGGNFNLAATWTSCGATTPQTTDSIAILNGDTVTLVAATNVSGVTINSGGILDANTRALTDSDGYLNNGSHTGTTATMILTGSGSVIDGSGSYAPTGLVTMNTGAKSVASGSSLTFPSVTVTGVTVTNNSTAGFTVATALAGTGGLVQGSGATLNINGASAITTLSATASGNTVRYGGAGAQTLKGTTYENLIIAGGNTVTNSSATTTIQSTGTLSVLSGTLNLSTKDFVNNGTTSISGTLSDSSATGADTFVGLVVVNPGGVWTDGGNSAYTFRGGVSNNGSFTSGTGLYTFDTNSQIIDGSNAISISSMAITGVTVTNTNGAGLTIGTALSGTGTLKQGTGSILNLGGTIDSITLDASANPNDVHYTSTTANQNIATSTYANLFIDKTGRIGTLIGVITVNGNLTVTAGTLADGGLQITGNATGVLTMNAGTTLILGTTAASTTFPTLFATANISLATTSIVNYNSDIDQMVSRRPVYGNLTTTATVPVTKTATGAITVNGLFTNGINNTFADGGSVITLKDGIVMTGAYTGTGKIIFTGGSAIHSITGTGSYNNVELDDPNGLLQSGTTNIGGTLTVTSGSWSPDGVSLTVVGTTTISGAISFPSTAGTKTFGDITINPGGAMNFTAVEAVTVNGNLLINGTGAITGTAGIWTFQKPSGGSIGGTASPIVILGSLTFGTQYTLPPIFTVNTLTASSTVNETNAGTTTINTALSGAGTFTQGAGTVLNLKGTAGIAVLDASANPNEVHYVNTTSAQTMKAATYHDLFIDKTGQTASAGAGTTTVLGNVTVTAGTLNLGGSTFVSAGTTDIFGTLTDNNGGPVGGNNIFQGLVNIHAGAHWTAIVGEICDFHFQNGLVINGASFVSATGVYYFETNNQSITGSSSFTIDNLAVNGIQLTNSSAGILSVRTALSGTGEFIQDANAVLNINGTSTIATLTAGAGGNTVSYATTTVQMVHAGTYQTLDVSGNTSGSVNIVATTTVNTGLILGPTVLSAGSSKVLLGETASVSRTSGYVFGTIEKSFNSSASFTFDIGDGSTYAPIDLTITGVTGTSSVDGSVTNADHTDIASSGIDPSKSVNRFWTLVNNGLSFVSYSPVFHFVSGDVDPGANVTNMRVSKKTAGTWTITPSVCSGTSCSMTGLTTMSDFQTGEALDQIPPTVVLTSSETSPTGATTLNMTATWSEPVTGFTQDGIAVTHGTAGNFVAASSSVYTFDITSPIDGTTTTALIIAGVAHDASLNDNATSTQFSIFSDQTPAVPSSASAGSGAFGRFGSFLASFFGITTVPNASVQPPPSVSITVPGLPNTGRSGPNTETMPPSAVPSVQTEVISPPLFDVISSPVNQKQQSPIPFMILAVVMETGIISLGMFVIRRIRAYHVSKRLSQRRSK